MKVRISAVGSMPTSRPSASIKAFPAILVPDNQKSGVSEAHRYEPDVNPTYHEVAEHYGEAVIPTCKAAPKDKAMPE